MNVNKLIITPKTKIGEILNAYPELEKVLFELSPAFKKLKNPILRKTIAKVATLQQAAAIGNITVDKIVNTLRKEAGQNEMDFSGSGETNSATRPDWLDEKKVTARLNAIPLINSGENPMEKIFGRLKNIQAGEILVLTTPFVPAPILEMLKNKNYSAYTVKVKEEEFESFILKPD